MKTPLNNLWLIGKLKWKNGFANASVAQTKTEARQIADRRLASAAFIWQKDGGFVRRFWKQYSQSKYADFDKYAEAVVCGKYHSSESYQLRLYLLLKEGIWLTGPQGEKIHIKEPSPTAIRERAKLNKASDKMIKSMLQGLKTSLTHL